MRILVSVDGFVFCQNIVLYTGMMQYKTNKKRNDAKFIIALLDSMVFFTALNIQHKSSINILRVIIIHICHVVERLLLNLIDMPFSLLDKNDEEKFYINKKKYDLGNI